LSRPAEQSAGPGTGSLAATYGTTFLLTLSNPATILSFVAVFAGFGLGQAADYAAAIVLVLGVFTGSALWWMILSGGVGLIRNRVSVQWMKAINRLSGCILLAFGLYALSRLIK
jgi:threonine/homoserine/homoserine lactone efflux protein